MRQRISGLEVLQSALDLGEITHELNIELATVAPLYYQLGERLGLDELKRQAARLPFDNPWQERARMDIGDELSDLQRKIAAQVLLGYTSGTALDAVLDPWLAYHREAIQRIHVLLAELRTCDPPDFAMMTVLVGEVRGLGGVELVGCGKHSTPHQSRDANGAVRPSLHVSLWGKAGVRDKPIPYL